MELPKHSAKTFQNRERLVGNERVRLGRPDNYGKYP